MVFFRNRAKKNSLSTTNQVFLLLKTTFDCISKVLMFATLMYVVNNGQFSSMMTLTAFYCTLAVLIIFNIIVNDNSNYKSAKTWIGKGPNDQNCLYVFDTFYLVLEILLNAWSSVLSYNHFNFDPIFSKQKENVGHQSTFVRQTFYFLINLASNIG